jgi:tryptophan synthase alpha subunit
MSDPSAIPVLDIRPNADAQTHSGRASRPSFSNEERYAMGFAIATHSHLQNWQKRSCDGLMVGAQAVSRRS